ncbi:MAG: hypothetical protein JNL21_27725 [Myxococcales bacterium]|nr:hypothetical protein [Myxococcales bacterium]
MPRPKAGTGNWYGPYVELCRALTILLAETEGDIDPALDPWITTPPRWAAAEWEAVLTRLPQDRRDAVILAAHAENLANTSFLHLASDAAIDTAIGRIFADRKRLAKHPDSLVFAALGSRATAPLVKHFSGAQNDKDAKRVLDQTELDDATYAALTGGGTVLPPVTGSIANGAPYLSLVAPHLAAASPAGSLVIRSGRLAFVREAGYAYATTLARSVPVGAHAVTAYYSDPDSDDLDALPTAGLEALMVRFAPGTPTQWEEATDERGDTVLTRELVTMALVDAEERRTDLASAHVTETERRMTHGDAVGFLDDGRALVAYVGEVALEHALYWGLDKKGKPLCLVAAFELPKG